MASPDLKWNAMSTRTRGGVWTLEKKSAFFIYAVSKRLTRRNAVFFLDFRIPKAEREIGVLSRYTANERPCNRLKEMTSLFGAMFFLQTKHNDKIESPPNLIVKSRDIASANRCGPDVSEASPRITGSAYERQVIYRLKPKRMAFATLAHER